MRFLIFLSIATVAVGVPVISGANFSSVANTQAFRAFSVDKYWPDSVGTDRLLVAKGVRAAKTPRERFTVDAAAFYINTLFSSAISFGYFGLNVAGTPGAAPTADTTAGAGQAQVEISAATFESWLRFFDVIEYDEVNGVDGFQVGADTVTGWYKLSNWGLLWKPFSHQQTTVTSNGASYQAHTFEVQTLDDVFLLRVTVVGQPSEVSGIKINPELSKIDFEVRWFNNPKFPYVGAGKLVGWNGGQAVWGTSYPARPDCHAAAPQTCSNPLWPLDCCIPYSSGPSNATEHPNARIAVTAAVAAKTNLFSASATRTPGGSAGGSPQPAVEFTFDSKVKGVFTWKAEADYTTGATVKAGAVWKVNGQKTDDFSGQGNDINAAIATGWSASVMAFAFSEPRPDLIVWDPEFGAEVAVTPAGTDASSGMRAGPAVVVLALLALARFF